MRALEFLKDYFNEDENFIIAQKYPELNGKVKHHHTMLNTKDKNIKSQLGRFYYMNKDNHVDIYFTLHTFKKQNSPFPSRKEKYVDKIKSFYFDIDKGDTQQKKAEIINLLGHPTYIIETSKDKYQFIYKFKEPYIVENIEQIVNFKNSLKGFCHHFKIDKIQDTARVFRLVDYMNKKPKNNNFKVTIKKYLYLHNFADFEKIARKYLLPENKPKTPIKKESKTLQKTIISKKTDIESSGCKFDKYKGIKKVINRKYNELLEKYNGDKSTADLGYARWLRTAKQITDEDVIIEKIFKARGYKNLMETHGYQTDYYFENILEKSKV